MINVKAKIGDDTFEASGDFPFDQAFESLFKIWIAARSVQGRDVLLAIDQRLASIEAQFHELKTHVTTQGERFMAEVTDQVRDVLTAIDTATNDLATRVETKIAQLSEGMDADEAAPLLAFGTEIAERLRGIAADPQNPVPAPTPEPAPEPPPGA